MTTKGLLFVFSAPSGAGKDSILNRIIGMDPSLLLSVSATTRTPRKGEIDGKDYHFLDETAFIRHMEQDNLLEYDRYCGHYYGTLKSAVEKPLAEGKDMILEITVPGALKVKELFPDCVLIFITPPDLEELERRIRKRGTESEEKIKTRLAQAAEEITFKNRYDHVIVNDQLDRAVLDTWNLIEAKRKERRENRK